MNYSTVKYIIYLCGIYALAFAVFHAFFWKLFDWKNDLKKITIANRAIIQIANLRLIYIFLGIAAMCFIFPKDLLSTRLGNAFLLGIAIFWIGRTIEQYVFLNLKNRMLNILTALFILGAVLFASPVVIKLVFFEACSSSKKLTYP